MRSLLLSATLTGFLIAASLPTSAQDGANPEASFTLDFVTDTNDTQTETLVESTPTFFEVDGTQRFRCTLVLPDVENLIGLSCDLRFNPSVLQVVSIHEARGDLNFDGRVNISDVLTIGERFGDFIGSNPEWTYFNLDNTGSSAGILDGGDVDALLPLLESNPDTLFWTANPDASNLDSIRESVEIFEDPLTSNSNGLIDDIAVVLLRRPEVPVEGFGFDGDARIVDIEFEIIGGDSGQEVSITLEDGVILDESSVVNEDGSLENVDIPDEVTVTLTLP